MFVSQCALPRACDIFLCHAQGSALMTICQEHCPALTTVGHAHNDICFFFFFYKVGQIGCPSVLGNTSAVTLQMAMLCHPKYSLKVMFKAFTVHSSFYYSQWGDKTSNLKYFKCSIEPKKYGCLNTIMNGTAFFLPCHSGSIFSD